VTRRERVLVVALAGIFAVLYSLYGLFRHWHFGSSAYDLGIFDQVVWHLSRFETPSSSVRGFPHFLADHFFPIIALFTPLYWIAPAAETLIVAQAVLFGASLIPVYAFARGRLPAGPAVGLTTAYALFWGIQSAMAFDVHETAFAPLLIGSAILALDRRAWSWFWLLMTALVFVKEDMLPLLTCFGILLVIQGDMRRGLWLIFASVVAAGIVLGVIIPAYSDARTYGYSAVYAEVLRRPWTVPLVLVSPVVKVRTMALWLAPFLFLPLRSPLCVLLLPFIATRFLSSSPTHWGTAFHYNAPLAPILAMAAADGLARVATTLAIARRPRAMPALVGAMVVASAILPGNQPLWRVFRPRHYLATPVHAAGYEALAMIPAGASVVAQAAIVPHLSQRDRVYVLDVAAPRAEFVITSRDASPWPAPDQRTIEEWVRRHRDQGYVELFARHGWTVLRKDR
jgi:uncharacterized membrane protein